MKIEFCEFSREVARYTGKKFHLKGFRNRDTRISYKSSTDIVTSVDVASEKYIIDCIRKKYPSHSIIAEEGGSSDRDSDYIWIIDPLDGTNNFAHGIAHYCVSIAVFSREENRIISGVVYEPNRDEMFHAFAEGGSFLNGEKINVSVIGDLGISILATGFPYDKKDFRINNMKQIEGFISEIQCLRRNGSAALDLCYVASGRFEGYWEGMLNDWDIAAGILICREAGGRVTDYKGNDFAVSSKEIAASNSIIHDSMLNILEKNTDYYPNEI